MALYHRKLMEAAMKRVDKVVKLRTKGKTWKEIGLMLDISPQRAQQLGKRGGL